MSFLRKQLPRVLGSDFLRSNAVLVFIVALVGFVLLELWRWSPDVPLSLGGDNSFYLMHAENLARGGSFYFNNLLGAPVGQHMHDYPAVGEWLNYELLRILALATGNAPLAESIFYFLTFFFVAIASNITCRRLGLSKQNAVAVSLLFTFLPYHMIKNVQHLMLSNYVAIPLIVFSSLAILQPSDQHSNRRQFLVLFSVGLLSGGTGIYYSIFSMLIVTLLGLSMGFGAQVRRRTIRLWSFFVSGMSVSLFISLVPVLKYGLENGFQDFQRTFVEVEYYGLKIANLFRPIVDHRIGLFSDFSEKFAVTLIPGEPAEMTGLIGSVGLILLFARFFTGRVTSQDEAGYGWRQQFLLRIALFVLVFASVGALNSFLFVLGLQQIRVWSRVAPLVAFCGISFFALWLQQRQFNVFVGAWRRRILLVVVVFLGLLDQTSSSHVPRYEANKIRWEQEERFTKSADAHFPHDSRILQVPVVKFPENGPQLAMEDYYQVFPFVHGSQLKWSYGNIKTRRSVVHERASQLNGEQLILFARGSGYAGIHIVRNGFVDNAESLLEALKRMGGRIVYQAPEDTNVLVDLSAID